MPSRWVMPFCPVTGPDRYHPRSVDLRGQQTFIADRVHRMEGSAASKDNGWAPGDLVRLCEGPCADFPGKLLSVERGQGLVEIMVDIFGRETQVEGSPGPP
jgi:transcription antitermination factor NusG